MASIKSGKIKTSIKTSILAKLIAIQSQLPDIFDEVIERPSLLGDLESFYRTQNGDQRSTETTPDSNPTTPKTQASAATQQEQKTATETKPLDSTDKDKEEDKLFHDLAKRFETDHPELCRILLKKVDKDDTFINVDMEHYIALIGILAVVRPITEELIHKEEIGDVRRITGAKSFSSRDRCPFFEMKSIEFVGPGDKVTNEVSEIKIPIKGLMAPGRGTTQECELTLYSNTIPSSIAYASPLDSVFHEGSYSQRFAASTFDTLEIRILVKGTGTGQPHQEAVNCSFRHGPFLDDSAHEHRQSILFEVDSHIPQFAFVLSKKSLVVGIDNVELIISSTA